MNTVKNLVYNNNQRDHDERGKVSINKNQSIPSLYFLPLGQTKIERILDSNLKTSNDNLKLLQDSSTTNDINEDSKEEGPSENIIEIDSILSMLAHMTTSLVLL